jgi:hypothetical protein
MLACLHAPLTVDDRNLAHRQQNKKQSREFATMGLGYMLRHSKRAWRTGDHGQALAYAAGVVALSPLAPLVPIGVATLVEDGSTYASNDKATSVRRRKVLAYLYGLGKQLKSLQPMSRTEVRLVDGSFQQTTYAVARKISPEHIFDTVAAVRRDLAELAADPDREAVEVRAYTSIRKKVRALEKACAQLEAELS